MVDTKSTMAVQGILILLVLFVSPSLQVHPSKTKELYIGGIFPMSGSWAGGHACFPSATMALEDINNRSDILPGYVLMLAYNDSKCSAGLGTQVMYELLYKPPAKIMFIVGCSLVSTFVAQAAKMWNVIVLAYGSSSPALSDRSRFPTFFRTHPSANLQNPTRIKLLERWNWTRVATIQHLEEVFTSTMQDLENRARDAKIEIAVRTSFLIDPSSAVRSLKRQDARIIIGVFYEDYARKVFCEVYKYGLYGKRYVWLLIGWYPDDWYKPDKSINCTEEQMRKAAEGHFTTESMMLNQDDVRTVSGMITGVKTDGVIGQRKSTGRLARTHDWMPRRSFPEAPLAYDAVWALALAFDKVSRRLEKKNMKLEEFSYGNQIIYKEIFAAMNETNFTGVSGQVYFTSEGDRIARTQIEQMIDGKYKKIGNYDDYLKRMDWIGGEKWIGGKPPYDRTQILTKLRVVSPTMFTAFTAVSTLGILVGLMLLIFNLFYRNRRMVNQAHWPLNSITVIGCVVCLVCVILLGLDGRFVSDNVYQLLCQLRVWILTLGFSLAYGSMFIKVWTVYRLTLAKKKEAQMPHINPWEMYVLMGVLLVIDVIVLAVWQILDPMQRGLIHFPKESPQDTDDDIKYLPQLEQCTCQHMAIWLGVIFGYKGLLLMFGILLSYETRNVKMKGLNDSKIVGMAIYNVVVLSLITAPITLIINEQQDASFAFVASAIILCTFLSMGLIFTPKIVDRFRHPLDGQDSATLNEALAQREEEERYQALIAENETMKREIAEKEEILKDLKTKIEEQEEQERLQPAMDEDEMSKPRYRHSVSYNCLLPPPPPGPTDNGGAPSDIDSALPTSSKSSKNSESLSELYL